MSRQRRGTTPRVVRSTLRDQASPDRIDRVWERLERNVVLGTAAARPAARRAISPRSAVTALALAAGFALGLGAAQLLGDRTLGSSFKLEPAPTLSAPLVFAAADQRVTYLLPGGGQLELEPDSIVDTEARGEEGLTLRLTRGAATLVTHPAGTAGRTTRVALNIGIATVTTSEGRIRIRMDGDNASLEMLDGTAMLREPTADHHMAERELSPREHRVVPIRIVTASNDPPPEQREPQKSAPEEVAAVEEAIVVEQVPGPVANNTVPPPPKPAWQVACDSSQFEEAVRLLGSASALDGVSNATYKQCIADGFYRLKDFQRASDLNNEIIKSPVDNDAKAIAWRQLAKLQADPAVAKQYKANAEALEKSAIPDSEPALCESVKAAHSAKNVARVRELAAQYLESFPDGECASDIKKILAELPKEEPPPAEPPAEQKEPKAP
jgi:hypothetical protein